MMRHLIALFEQSDDRFERWFTGSKIVNPDGSPMMVYHGTKHHFDAFEPNELGLIFFSPHHGTARQFSLINDPTARFGIRSERVIKAYLRAVNPFDYSNETHQEALFDRLDFEKVIEQYYANDKSNFKQRLLPEHVCNLIRRGSWTVLETPEVLKTIRDLGHDALYLVEFGEPTIAVFENGQVWPLTEA